MTALSCVWSVFFCLFLFHNSNGKKKLRVCLSMKKYGIVCEIITLSFLSYCLRFVFFSPEQSVVEIYVSNTQLSVGTSYISVTCDRTWGWFYWDKTKIKLFLQCRQNKSSYWETIVKLNDSGSFITNISKDIETHLEKNGTCDYDDYRYGKECRIYANISIHLESCKGYLDPSFRCQIFDIERIAVRGSREVQVEITSK